MSKYYYHATNDLITFKDILSDREIKCARLLGKTLKRDLDTLSFNGLDYISVCNKLDDYSDIYGESSFDQFICDRLCFIISDEIDVIKPTIIDWTDFYHYMAIKEKMFKDMEQCEHVSFYIDEYRTKNRITIDKILGIGIPFDQFYSKEELTILKQILLLASEFNLDIVDSSDESFIEKYEGNKYNNEDIVKKIKGLGL